MPSRAPWMALLTLLAICQPSLLAEATIDPMHRMYNRADIVADRAYGYCAFVCLDMMARQQGITSVIGITDDRMAMPEYETLRGDNGRKYTLRRNYGSGLAIREDLRRRKASFHWQPCQDKDLIILHYAQKNNLPCMVAMYSTAFGGNEWDDESHAVIVLDFGPKMVKILDPNHPNTISTHPRSWYNRHWTGYALVLRPPEAP